MKFSLIHLTLAIASTSAAAPIRGTLLGGLSGVLGPVVNGLGTLFGAPNLPNQTGSIITLPIIPGTGFDKPNTCRCKAVGKICGYRAYFVDDKPIEAVDGGSCDPLAVYTCNQANTFGSSATSVLCLASFSGHRVKRF